MDGRRIGLFVPSPEVRTRTGDDARGDDANRGELFGFDVRSGDKSNL